MDHLRIMGFLVLLFTTLSSLQFAEARVLEHQFHNAALSQHNSAVDFDSGLDAVAVASSRQNYSGPGGHVANYSESNTGSNSEISTHAANNTIITVDLLQKEATPGDGSNSKAPARIKEIAPIEGNADILHEMLNSHSSPGVGHLSVHGGVEGNVLSSSGKSPGVGHWEKSKTKYSTSLARTTPNNVLSSGPSPGVGNAHTSAIAGTQSELGTFNKLPSGSSPGVGHKVTDGYTEMGQDLESKKSASAMMMNILPSGPSPGGGNSATNGRNMMEKISIESESSKKTARARESESKSKSAIMMNILSSGPSPGVGNSATNGRNMMEKMSKEDEEGMGIQTFNRLPSGPSPGVGHSYTNAHQPEKLQTVSEDTKGSDHIPIFHKLPGGPSPGGGHSYVQKSASPARTTPNNVFSGPSPGVGNAHTSAIAGTQSELGTFNKLPSGSSPGVGHKVTDGYTEMGQDLESKKSAMMMNILPSGPSPGVGNSATNGRNMLEKMSKEDEEGMGSSPGIGHSYTNAHLPEKLQTASEDRKGSDHNPVFHKLPGSPSPGGGHSYVQKSASTVRMQSSSNALRKTYSSPSPGDGNSSMNKWKGARRQKKKVEQSSGALDWKIGCDGGGLDLYGTPTPPMFGIATAGS